MAGRSVSSATATGGGAAALDGRAAMLLRWTGGRRGSCADLAEGRAAARLLHRTAATGVAATQYGPRWRTPAKDARRRRGSSAGPGQLAMAEGRRRRYWKGAAGWSTLVVGLQEATAAAL